MQFDDVILGRRSIRGYKPDPVPKELIKEIIALAMRAPSSMNTQPWNFYIVTGEPLNRIRAGNTERNLAGVPTLVVGGGLDRVAVCSDRRGEESGCGGPSRVVDTNTSMTCPYWSTARYTYRQVPATFT